MEYGRSFNRREFLNLAGSTLALTGLNACTKMPFQQIAPYVRSPERITPGKPNYYSTAFLKNGYSIGILAETHMGRPTKLEGNPDHPASLGATDAIIQGELHSLYNPERSSTVLHQNQLSTWDEFLSVLSKNREQWDQNQGSGVHFLSEPITSPTLTQQIHHLLERFPLAQWHTFDPLSLGAREEGIRLAYGQDADFYYQFQNADVILSLDCDFLSHEPGSLRYASDFAERRRSLSRRNRLYVIQSAPSLAGAVADHTLISKASRVLDLSLALGSLLGVLSSPVKIKFHPYELQWLHAVSEDLKNHLGSSLVVCGTEQSAPVHALMHLINRHLNNHGKTIFYIPPVKSRLNPKPNSWIDLARQMKEGKVSTLFVFQSNPNYTFPIDLDFESSYRKIPFTVHLGTFVDETAKASIWHLPETHFLESWSDARSYDGTVTILQPVLNPLYPTRSMHEVVSLIDGPSLHSGNSGYATVRETWKKLDSWEKSLNQGVIANTAFKAQEMILNTNLEKLLTLTQEVQTSPSSELELIFRPDPFLYDGRYAHNPWLQELFRPITTLSWGNAGLVNAKTAHRLGIKNQDILTLSRGIHTIEVPILIVPHQADDSITLSLGFGRTQAGSAGSQVGYNAYLVRFSHQPLFTSQAKVQLTQKKASLAIGQETSSMEGRQPVQVRDLQNLKDPAHSDLHPPEALGSLLESFLYPGYAWGMAINLDTCIGCAACVIACQAENNIPSVGKDQIRKSRDLYWIRVDRYYSSHPENFQQTYFQPVPCMHCENAPCELVCPTYATVHDNEGLNEMIYNRCVGTRYCSNNCPYKVRRFNFLQYSDYETKTYKLMHNPDVSVRSRGVMEKCTYCIQRISEKRIEAQKENRKIREGELKTACQQVCPTQTISFGDINNPESKVAQLRKSPLHYGLLSELGTRPRTTYLARVTNFNPKLGPGP